MAKFCIPTWYSASLSLGPWLRLSDQGVPLRFQLVLHLEPQYLTNGFFWNLGAWKWPRSKLWECRNSSSFPFIFSSCWDESLLRKREVRGSTSVWQSGEFFCRLTGNWEYLPTDGDCVADILLATQLQCSNAYEIVLHITTWVCGMAKLSYQLMAELKLRVHLKKHEIIDTLTTMEFKKNLTYFDSES